MYAKRAIRQFFLIFASSVLCFAADVPGVDSTNTQEIHLAVKAGVPLRVELAEDTPIRGGQPVHGTLVHALHAFDREVVPAGATVLGRVSKVQGAAGKQRVKSYMRGRLRSKKEALVKFETLVLADGARIPLETSVTQGVPAVIRLSASAKDAEGEKQKEKKGVVASAKEKVKSTVANNELVRALRSSDSENKASGKKVVKQASGGIWRGLRNSLLAYWPFGVQKLRAGTNFTAVLEEPLDFGTANIPDGELRRLGSAPAPNSVVQARLLETISSDTAQVGSPVKAVITQPLFSPEGDLLLPEGAQMEGEVTEVKPARRLGRDGKLRFRFTKIEMPSGLTQPVSGSLAAVEVDRRSRMKLDEEGGATVAPSKKRFITPAMAVAVQMTAVPDGDDGAPPETTIQGSAPGWSGFGLLGSALALSAPATAAPLGIWGAANSVYFNLIRKADELVFPENTLLEIRFGRVPEEEERLPQGPPKTDKSRDQAEPKVLRTR